MTARHIFASVIVVAAFAGCGGSSSGTDESAVDDIRTDSIIGTDTGTDVSRVDVNGTDTAAVDGVSRDVSGDGAEIEPCRPGESCDDRNPCTVGDLCDDDGVCAGVPVEACDDGIECTFDQCSTADECTHEVKPGWCFIDGKCIEDGDVDPEIICKSCQTALKTDELLPDDNLPCDDGDSCTVNDRCHEGACIADFRNCGDDNPCTADMCSGGSCIHENVEGMCDDGNLCTENDLCVDGECKGSLIGCWDQNPCTQDACHPDFGCVHDFLDIPCEDGNICTVGDRCFSGLCVPGDDRLDCDDENPCTDDGCVPIRQDGCVHIPNVAACDDGDPCTLNDSCKATECMAGTEILDCDDNNVCTRDFCRPGVGCVNEFNTDPCDDGEPCSVNDVCRDGACQPGVTELECDDGNECTSDRCETGVGCVFENNFNVCDDDNVCTVGDVCGDGVCLGLPQKDMCDDGNDCTLDFCLPNGVEPGCHHKAKPECRPQIIIDYPPRAATLNGARDIEIRGHVEYPIPGLIVPFVNVNGMDVMVSPNCLMDPPPCASAGPSCDDYDSCTTNDRCVVSGTGFACSGTSVPGCSNGRRCSFETDMYMVHGINPIVAKGTDVAFGYQDYVVQSVYYSDTWIPVNPTTPANSMVYDGVKIFLGKTVWDDNDTSTPDDIATLISQIVQTLDISTLITNPVTKGSFGWCDYKVNLNHIRYGTLSIDLVPDWGKLKVKVVIPRFKVDVDVPISGFGCPDFDGTASADTITINADLLMSIDASGNPVASIQNPDVVVSGLVVDIGGIWGFLFNWIVDFFEDDFAGMIEDEFENQLAGQISDLIAGAIADLALEPEFELPALLPGMQPAKLQLVSKFSTVAFTPDGSDVGLYAAFMPDKTKTPPRQILGSIGRGACLGTDFGEPVMPHNSEMALFAKDDILNEALYAMWASGTFVIPVGPEMLGDIDLTTYGVSNLSLTVDFMLPPLISDCNVQHKMFFQAGDIKITASMKLFGTMMTMTMYASLSSEARIVLVQGASGTEVGIQVETPLFIDIEVAQIDGGLVGAEDTISGLIRGVAIPMVLDLLTGDTLASFQLPSIDLSSLGAGLPAGAVIEIDMKSIERSKGATIVAGNVK